MPIEKTGAFHVSVFAQWLKQKPLANFLNRQPDSTKVLPKIQKIMKKYLIGAVAALSLSLGASADTIALWDFNTVPSDDSFSTGTLLPATGTGIAAPVGVTGGPFFNAAAGSSDPTGADANDSAWRIINFPAQGTANLTAGVEFHVDTTGYENITLQWDQNNAGGSSKYWRVFYSTDNGVTWVPKDLIVNNLNATWNNPITNISFVSITGANNNTNFGVRFLSEFQSTAIGSGTAGYVTPTGNNYNTTAAFRLDMVIFSGSVGSGNVNILTNPSDLTVAAGQPASFSVFAGGGSTAIGYQWRSNSTPILNATNSVYTIASAQFSDAGNYDVVVTNSINSVTSDVAVLTVRAPLNLAWTGLGGPFWDNVSVSWVDTNTSADVAYTGGDNVLFDSRGVSSPSLSLTETLQPSSVTVDADFDYLLRSDGTGNISGATGINKRGTGTLILDTDNTYSGPTVIEAGAVQIGQGDTHGSLGSGRVTNNSALVFNRSDSVIIGNNISGSGAITNLGASVTLTGSNVYNGDISILSGALQFSGNQTVNSANVRLIASGTGIPGSTTFTISGGINTSPTTALTTYGNGGVGDYRIRLSSASGSNVWNGPIYLSGINGQISNQIQSDGTTTDLHINGDISGIDGFAGSVTLRGAGNGTVAGRILLPGLAVQKTDAGIWTIASTNNQWAFTTVGVGTLKLGANNALPTDLTFVIGQQANQAAAFDLNGFNQQLAVFQDSTVGTSSSVTNSSSISDSTLTLTGNSAAFSGVIVDGATRKTGLTLNGGATFTLKGNNTYTGPTTINGVLTLSENGAIQNTAVINLGVGSTLDVSTRVDSTLALASGQTLKGDGTFNIGGSLSSVGTIELKINKSGATVTGDQIQGINQLTYGGTLHLVLSGNPLSGGDSVKLFNAVSYSGAFDTIVPATPGAGLLWDTSTMTTDGTLRVTGSGAPSVTTTFQSGNNIVFAGSGGTANATYYVLTSTNVAAAVETWTPVQTNQFDASGNFSVTNAILPGVPSNFYLLQVVP
jgi:autotransporter-associated beta strand protein